MPRQNRRREDEAPLTANVGSERREEFGGEEYIVRTVPGAAAGKSYRCPGCDQLIPPGRAHLVCWPDHADVEHRRHWHTGCWAARDRRGPR